MWLKERDRLINLEHVAVIEAYDRFLAVWYAGEEMCGRVPHFVKEYEDEGKAAAAVGDLATLITEIHDIPFDDNNVVFEI